MSIDSSPLRNAERHPAQREIFENRDGGSHHGKMRKSQSRTGALDSRRHIDDSEVGDYSTALVHKTIRDVKLTPLSFLGGALACGRRDEREQ